MHGLVNVHKPAGLTSRDVVNQLQRLVRPAKIGHAGTLDPLATGVLVVCVGAATRLVEYVQQLPKVYFATFLLGRRSDTEDIEGTVELIEGATPPAREELEARLPEFLGEIQQRPPQFSALKVGGQRAYELARRGESVELAARPVTIYELELVRYEYPIVELRVRCGSGTYIRSLGRDLAESLGTAAVMSQLTREAIGPFQLADAVDPRTLSLPELQAALLPSRLACEELPQVAVTGAEAIGLQHGRWIPRPDHGFTGPIAALDDAGNLVAIVIPADSGQLRPDKVLPTI